MRICGCRNRVRAMVRIGLRLGLKNKVRVRNRVKRSFADRLGTDRRGRRDAYTHRHAV